MSVEYYDHTCACGCGGRIKVTKRHKYRGIPKYISGHAFKLKGKLHHSYKHGKNKCRAHKNELSRKYRAKHRDRIKKYNSEYRAKHREDIYKRHKEWVFNNKDRKKKIANNWTQRNLDYVLLTGFLREAGISIKREEIHDELYVIYKKFKEKRQEVRDAKSKLQINRRNTRAA